VPSFPGQLKSKAAFVLVLVSILAQSTAIASTAQGKVLGTELKNSARSGGNLNSTQHGDDVLAESDVDTKGSPANGGNAGASNSAQFSGYLRCNPQSPSYIGGVGLKGLTCITSGDQITAIDYQVCTASKHGGSCDGNWGATQRVSNGGSRASKGVTVALTCKPGESHGCDAALRYTETLTYGEDDITGAAAQMALSEGDGVQGMLNDSYSNPTYHSELGKVGSDFNECTQNVNSALEGGGLIYTCDGNQAADMGRDCQVTKTCKEYRTQGLAWENECVADIKLVNNSCNQQIPEGTCTTQLEQGDYSCNKELLLEAQTCDVERTSTTHECTRWLVATVVKGGCPPGTLLKRQAPVAGIDNRLYCTSNGVRIKTLQGTAYAYGDPDKSFSNRGYTQTCNSKTCSFRYQGKIGGARISWIDSYTKKGGLDKVTKTWHDDCGDYK